MMTGFFNKKIIFYSGALIFAALLAVSAVFLFKKEKPAENGRGQAGFESGFAENRTALPAGSGFSGSVSGISSSGLSSKNGENGVLWPIGRNELGKKAFIFGEKLKEQLNGIVPIQTAEPPSGYSNLSETAFSEETLYRHNGKPYWPQYSDEEYFRLYYTERYVSYLHLLQNLMAKDGFIKEGGKVEFEKEQDTYPVLTKFVDYAVVRKFIGYDRGERLKFGINVTLRQININERPNVEQYLLQGRKPFSLYWYGIAGQIFAILSPEVYAQSGSDSGSGSQSSSNECYEEGSGSSGGSGSNSWAMCCQCGLYCSSSGCTYVSDCSQSYCNVDLGCLNQVCGDNNPGIWDEESGTCGCDP